MMLSRCTSCGATLYPARILCPVCGGASWTELACGDGQVEECTTLPARDGLVLASVRCAAGPVVIARLDRALPRGTRVHLAPGAGRALLARPAG